MINSGLILLMAVVFLHFPMTVFSGDLDSPAPPEDPDSAMYTLEDIYNRLDDGTEGERRTDAFKEPNAGPTVGTGHDLNEIMEKAPVEDNTNGAVPADVTDGRTYWGLRTDGTWGPQTGTSVACPPAPTGNATVNDVRLGKTFSNQTGVGLTGEGLCPSTCMGDATENDVQSGKTFSNETEVGLTGNRHGGCVCSGTLNGTRWCDNGDGTVTDLNTCLVWLKDASWGGQYVFWVDTQTGTNAQDRASQLYHGVGGLSDGSVVGSWRLPTKTELHNLSHGIEAVSMSNIRAFTGVQHSYWSSNTNPNNPDGAWFLDAIFGNVLLGGKSANYYVWPVRAGQ
jgi:hypothetical protein